MKEKDPEEVQNYIMRELIELDSTVNRLLSTYSNDQTDSSYQQLAQGHSELISCYCQTRQLVEYLEHRIRQSDGSTTASPTPKTICKRHSDHLSDKYDHPLDMIAMMLVEANKHEWLHYKPDTVGADRVREQGLVDNQKEWLDTVHEEMDTSSGLSMSEYQDRTEDTALEYVDPDSHYKRPIQSLFTATAINGEAGELAEKAKKYVREDDETYLDELESEIGDTLYYLARMADILGTDLDTIAQDNLDKLSDRAERGQITGQGDNR